MPEIPQSSQPGRGNEVLTPDAVFGPGERPHPASGLSFDQKTGLPIVDVQVPAMPDTRRFVTPPTPTFTESSLEIRRMTGSVPSFSSVERFTAELMKESRQAGVEPPSPEQAAAMYLERQAAARAHRAEWAQLRRERSLGARATRAALRVPLLNRLIKR